MPLLLLIAPPTPPLTKSLNDSHANDTPLFFFFFFYWLYQRASKGNTQACSENDLGVYWPAASACLFWCALGLDLVLENGSPSNS